MDKLTGGAAVDYKNGPKNNWRRWAWNRICERVDDKKNVKVLYLSGRQDLDRRVAVSKGFSPNNLYAVDNDPGIVRDLRKKGANAICGDFFNVFSAGYDYWDVVYGDLCCGITPSISGLARTIIATSHKERVYLLNLQRGRDCFSSKIKELARWNEKNRSGLFFWIIAYEFLRGFIKKDKLDILQSKPEYISWFYNDFLGPLMNPAFNSYKGSRVYMDSVVLKVPVLLAQKLDSEVTPGHEVSMKKTAQSLAAVKAVAAMRQTGKLLSCPVE